MYLIQVKHMLIFKRCDMLFESSKRFCQSRHDFFSRDYKDKVRRSENDMWELRAAIRGNQKLPRLSKCVYRTQVKVRYDRVFAEFCLLLRVLLRHNIGLEILPP